MSKERKQPRKPKYPLPPTDRLPTVPDDELTDEEWEDPAAIRIEPEDEPTDIDVLPTLARSKDAQRNLETMINAVVGNLHSAEEFQRAVDLVLTKHDVKLRAQLIAAAQEKLERLARIARAMDHVEDKLLDPARLAVMEDRDMIALYRAFSQSSKEITDFVKNVIDWKQELDPTSLQPSEDELKDGALTALPTLPKDRRERIRNLLDTVVRGAQAESA